METPAVGDLTAYVTFTQRRAGDVVPGRSGERYRTGDALRFAISSGVATYFFLVVVEEDGKRSERTLHDLNFVVR